MTRAVAAFLHVSSSQSVYDDDRVQDVSSSVSEGESVEKNENGVIASRREGREAERGDCEVEISSSVVRLSGGVGEDALDHSAAVQHVRLARGGDQPSVGHANGPANECGKRKRACFESSVDQPWGSASEDTQPFGGWGHGSGVKRMEVCVVDRGAREDEGASFRGNKSAQHLVKPQANTTHVQFVFTSFIRFAKCRTDALHVMLFFCLPVSYFKLQMACVNLI